MAQNNWFRRWITDKSLLTQKCINWNCITVLQQNMSANSEALLVVVSSKWINFFITFQKFLVQPMVFLRLLFISPGLPT